MHTGTHARPMNWGAWLWSHTNRATAFRCHVGGTRRRQKGTSAGEAVPDRARAPCVDVAKETFICAGLDPTFKTAPPPPVQRGSHDRGPSRPTITARQGVLQGGGGGMGMGKGLAGTLFARPPSRQAGPGLAATPAGRILVASSRPRGPWGGAPAAVAIDGRNRTNRTAGPDVRCCTVAASGLVGSHVPRPMGRMPCTRKVMTGWSSWWTGPMMDPCLHSEARALSKHSRAIG